MHKPDQPTRPVVNWRNAPAYRLSRLFTDKMNHTAPLPQAFKIKNTQDLLRILDDTSLLPNYTLGSLDTTNLYSNVSVKETKAILANILTQKLKDPQTQQEILEGYDVITKQNYFAHKNKIVIQHDRLAMEIAEIFSSAHRTLTLNTRDTQTRIVNYCRHVDDILLIFDSNHTNIQKILDDFNTLHPKLQFTA